MLLHILLIVYLWCATKGDERLNVPRHFKPLEKDVKVEYTLVGCYADKMRSRALGKFYFDAKKHLGKKLWSHWPDMSEAIKLCAEQAYQHGYRDMFAVQNYGECWSDSQASVRYNKYKESSACAKGVGGPLANSVYRMKVVHLAESSTCSRNGRNYSEGDAMKVLNEFVNIEDAVCQECTCARGKPAGCRDLYYCDLQSRACEKYIVKPGHCCPVCDCFHAGHVTSPGDKWVKRIESSCVECTCLKNGRASCRLGRVFCPVCDFPVPVIGQCCPKCVSPVPTVPKKYRIVTTTERPPMTFPPLPLSDMEKRNKEQ